MPLCLYHNLFLWPGNQLSFFFFLFIEFIGVTLVNKIIQVSGVQFYNTSSVHCIMCSPPQVTSPSNTIYLSYTLLHLPPPPPLALTTLLSKSMGFLSFFCLIPLAAIYFIVLKTVAQLWYFYSAKKYELAFTKSSNYISVTAMDKYIWWLGEVFLVPVL